MLRFEIQADGTLSGETDLDLLLRSMSPMLVEGEFVFCTFPAAAYGDHAALNPVASIRETEGLTLVVPRDCAAEQGLPCDNPFRCISLQVHSSLDAVGLTAAFATRLTEHGISANVIAGYYHDHLFVQSEQAERALTAIRALASER